MSIFLHLNGKANIRFLRDDRGTPKSVAGAFLVAGLLMGGHGIESTLATDEHTVMGGECIAAVSVDSAYGFGLVQAADAVSAPDCGGVEPPDPF